MGAPIEECGVDREHGWHLRLSLGTGEKAKWPKYIVMRYT
jgi:hypothetical protein